MKLKEGSHVEWSQSRHHDHVYHCLHVSSSLKSRSYPHPPCTVCMYRAGLEHSLHIFAHGSCQTWGPPPIQSNPVARARTSLPSVQFLLLVRHEALELVEVDAAVAVEVGLLDHGAHLAVRQRLPEVVHRQLQLLRRYKAVAVTVENPALKAELASA